MIIYKCRFTGDEMLSDAFKPTPVKDADGNEVEGLIQIQSQKVNKVRRHHFECLLYFSYTGGVECLCACVCIANRYEYSSDRHRNVLLHDYTTRTREPVLTLAVETNSVAVAKGKASKTQRSMSTMSLTNPLDLICTKFP
jgi:hypothetical protein